jgi:hypothetical protein
MSTLNFEVGKAYRTRDGRKAVCLTTTLSYDYPIGLQLYSEFIETTKKGRFYDDSETQNDIISEWIDKPVIDWATMPAWAKFVAMDSCRYWWWYNNKVTINNDYWEQKSGCCGRIPAEYAPKWDGDWKQSLIERP